MGRIGRVLDVRFASDGTLVTMDREGVLARWNPATGRRMNTVVVPQYRRATGRSIAITPDGTVIAASDQGGEIIMAKHDGGGPRFPLTSYLGLPSALDLSADGHLLATVGTQSAPVLFRINVDRLPHPQTVGQPEQRDHGAGVLTGRQDAGHRSR
jgi:glucose/arabinose dehydrogenase